MSLWKCVVVEDLKYGRLRRSLMLPMECRDRYWYEAKQNDELCLGLVRMLRRIVWKREQENIVGSRKGD